MAPALSDRTAVRNPALHRVGAARVGGAGGSRPAQDFWPFGPATEAGSADVERTQAVLAVLKAAVETQARFVAWCRTRPR
jgi:hypothetical protein